MNNQENTKDVEVNVVQEEQLTVTIQEEKPVEKEAEPIQEETKTLKQKFVNSKKWLKWVGVGVAILVASYICVALHYRERFLINTTINGEDCSSKSVAFIEEQMQKQVEEYTLEIKKANDETEVITGPEINVEYTGVDTLKEALAEQNPYLWIVALFESRNIEAELTFSYDKDKLDDKISKLECVKEENQTAPVDAKPVLENDVYVIQEEVYGTLLDMDVFVSTMHEKADKMETTIDLNDGCYVLPKYTKDSEEIIALTEALNKCLSAKVTYSLDGKTVNVDKTVVKDWISYDENLQLVVSTDAVTAFVKDSVASAYNTAPRTNHITTPTGKSVYVAGATVGRQIGVSQETEQLIGEIKAGTVTTRSPYIAQHATPAGQYSWGNTYAEVDISQQHMWFIQNGTPVFECAVITGNPSKNWDTPAGRFTILEKKRNKTLVGNIVPETGEPEYRTPVEYWMRVTWSGVGFHDCTWHPLFGGNIYTYAGSHGCINMPPASAAAFYNMVYVGCPVIIHY